MIKNVVFDNGGVIVKYSAETYLDYFHYPKEIQKSLDELFVSDAWVAFAKGEITSDEFKAYALNRFPQYKKEVLEILDVNNLKFMIPPYSETLDFIHELKTQGYKVLLLSDINEDTIQYLNEEIPNFESLFDGIVYSCRVGMVKKEGKVFGEMLDTYSLNPEETLFLDDSVRNLEEAKKFNIHTYRFLDPSKDIEEVSNLLQSLNNEETNQPQNI